VKDGYVVRFAATVQLLQKAPRTKKEVQTLLGIDNRDAVARYFDALQSEGLIEMSGRRSNRAYGCERGPLAYEYRWVRAEQE